MPQNYILHIETATEQCSVALSDGTDLIDAISVQEGFKHNENLMGFVQNLLQKSNLNFNNLSGIAVSSGPGSYTGLRIGVSSAKGLCYALSIPLIAVDTLQIMALEASKKLKADVYLPMIDARRMEVYSACYNALFQHFSFRAPLVMDADKAKEIAGELEGKRVAYFGNGADKLIDLFKHFHHFIYLPDIVPQAESMILPAFEAYQNQHFCDLAYFEPEYLKPFYTNHPAGT
ncbi:MAG: tRNA (adenosine(37)-N6)-threonylcarbamoyltransferase complex dimerization subunit type 1 TsaB [Flavobacteriales bacterium]